MSTDPLLLTDSFAGQTNHGFSVHHSIAVKGDSWEISRQDHISQTTFLSQTSITNGCPSRQRVVWFLVAAYSKQNQCLDEAPSTHCFLRLLRLIRGRGGAICTSSGYIKICRVPSRISRISSLRVHGRVVFPVGRYDKMVERLPLGLVEIPLKQTHITKELSVLCSTLLRGAS